MPLTSGARPARKDSRAETPTSRKVGEAMSEKDKNTNDINRRDFLRTSAYVAYATPIVLSLLVNKVNAAKSWNSGQGTITNTGNPPDNAPLGPNPNS